jgi:2-oxoglutarate ferredoxin oxidoreductase subunit gamma
METRQEIRLGGFGGQGIMLAGYVLGRAAITAGKHAVMTQAYGPEIRGARVAADVILDSEPIDYPKVTHPDISVFMGQEAYDYHCHEVGQTLIYDEDLVNVEEEHLSTDGLRVYSIQSNRIAEELGRRVVANIVMLGALTAITGLLPVEAMEEAVLRSVPKKALDLNKEAFRRGLEHGAKVLEEKK